MREPFDRAAEILLHGILDRAFPAAVAEAGRKDGPIWRRPFGTLTYDAGAPDTTNETVFDLASLTKVIATTTLAMRAVDDGLLTVSATTPDAAARVNSLLVNQRLEVFHIALAQVSLEDIFLTLTGGRSETRRAA